jgi:hypothetical protein
MELDVSPFTVAVNLADCPPRRDDCGDESCMLAGAPPICDEESADCVIPLPQPVMTAIQIAAIGNEQL